MMSINKKPTISIISSVYNVETYLPQCLDSILNQSFQDWELWLVDDGATDRSGAICDEYARKDERIHVLHKPNTGLSDSRNVALRHAKGEWIGFIDSDDWAEPDMFATLYRTAIEQEADIAICGHYVDYPDQQIPSCPPGATQVYNTDEALELILNDKLIKSYVWDKLYRRSVITEQFPQSFNYEDYRTVFKWFHQATRVAFTPVPLYHYRQRGNSIVYTASPRNLYHFFLAEQERFQYLTRHGIQTTVPTEPARRLVLTGLHTAKGIARCGKYNPEARTYIQTIYQQIAPLLPQVTSRLRLKERMHLYLLAHSVNSFISWMLLGKKNAAQRKKKRRVY